MRGRPGLDCLDERRRQSVRNSRLNGIDFIERVDGSPAVDLRVHLFHKAPHGLRPENVRIDGGRRIRDLRAIRVGADPAARDVLLVRLDREGDFSAYTLSLIEAPGGRPTGSPLRGFDPWYASAEFGFKTACPSDLDCAVEAPCPAPERQEPEISYLARDYATFRQLILDRLSLIMPAWSERHAPDVGITLVEILAYIADHLSYYQDAVATEAYLETARRRISIRRHVRLIDYYLHEGCNARSWLALETKDLVDPPVFAADLYFTTGSAQAPGEVFEPLVEDPSVPLPIYEAHNLIPFYTWGDEECCLP